MTGIADLFVRISAKDLTGGVFGRMNQSVHRVNNTVNRLNFNLTKVVVKAELINRALFAGMDLARGQARRFISEVNTLADLQLKNIQAATTFSSLTGQSYEDSAAVIESLNARLAESAAILPGATQDYKSLAIAIQDNVLEAFKDLNGNLDLVGFEDAVASISESYGALTAASTKMTGNTTLGLTKALSGAGIAELRNIAFFEQNPVILNELQDRLDEFGVTSLQQLDIKARVKLLEEVGAKFITEDFRTQASESVDGLIQSFRSVWFDPSTGILGKMRDLDPDTEGVQSVFTSFNEVLKNLIGAQGLFATDGPIAAIADALGINWKPLTGYKSMVDRLNGAIVRLNAFLFGVAEVLESGENARDLVTGVVLPKLSNGLANFLGNIAVHISKLPFGEIIASALNRLGGVLRSIDWDAVFSSMAQFLGLILNNLVSLARSIDYAGLITGVGDVISAYYKNLIGAFAKFIDDFNMEGGEGNRRIISQTLGQTIGKIANVFISALSLIDMDKLGMILGSGVGLLAAEIVNTMAYAIKQIDQGQLMNLFMDVLMGALRLLGSAIFAAIRQADFDVIGFSLQRALGTINIQAMAARAVGFIFSRITSAVTSALRNIIPGRPENSPGGGMLNRAQGQIPTGFFAALARERNESPPGATPVIANSSELIVPQRAIPQLLNATNNGASNNTTVNFNPVIQITATNGEQIARETLRYLNIFLDEHVQGALA
jgi:hypothetical protein